MKNFRQCREGGVAIEFAIVAPLVLVAILMVVLAGYVMLAQASLQHAVEMAARCASVNKTSCSTPSGIQNFARDNALGISAPSSVFGVAVVACGNQVTATYPLSTHLPFLGLGRITLSARACFPLPPS